MILGMRPSNKKDIPGDMWRYRSFRDEPSYQDGAVCSGDRAVIPDTLRADITRRIHSSHLRVEGCFKWVRECVYWQGMNENMKTFISKCDICRSCIGPKAPSWRDTSTVGKGGNRSALLSEQRPCDNSGFLFQILGGELFTQHKEQHSRTKIKGPFCPPGDSRRRLW